MARIEAEKKAREDAFNERQDQYTREIALAKALGKETFNLEVEKLNNQIEFDKQARDSREKQAKAAADAIQGLERQIAKSTSISQSRMLRTNQVILQERVDEYKKYVKAVKDGENELKILTINNSKEIEQKEKSTQKDRLANYKTYLQNRINAARKIEDQENQLLEEGIEKELEINRDKFNWNYL